MTHELSFKAERAVKATPFLLLPREHGSWGMLLFPLVSAVVVAGRWRWSLLAAAGAALAMFLLREPLLVMVRQRYVWRDVKPETAAARRSLLVFGAILAASGAWLAANAPLAWLVGLGLAAAALTAAAIYGALHNLQRSPLLQIAGAVGLTAAAFLPYLAVGRFPDEALALLMSAHVIHGAGSVLVVHARLEAGRALKTGSDVHARHVAAAFWLVLHATAAAALAFTGRPWLGVILAIPLAMHAADLARLKDPGFLRTPLRRVGFRELGLSAVFSALVVAALL
jgi:hypothetical protein